MIRVYITGKFIVAPVFSHNFQGESYSTSIFHLNIENLDVITIFPTKMEIPLNKIVILDGDMNYSNRGPYSIKVKYIENTDEDCLINTIDGEGTISRCGLPISIPYSGSINLSEPNEKPNYIRFLVYDNLIPTFNNLPIGSKVSFYGKLGLKGIIITSGKEI
jgi:hypothetical protein